VVATNCIEIYDFYVLQALEKKLNLVPDARFLYSPPELSIRLAYEQFGEIIFPLYSVFRSDPADKVSEGSYSTYRVPYMLSEEKSINQIMIGLKYDINFWAKNMFDMNKANKNYLNFQKDKTLKFNFSEIGLPELSDDMEVEIHLDKITSNHGIEKMFDIGRYFRWTYSLEIIGLEFDINKEVRFNKVIYGLYSENLNNEIMEFEEDIDV